MELPGRTDAAGYLSRCLVRSESQIIRCVTAVERRQWRWRNLVDWKGEQGAGQLAILQH